MTKSKNTCSHTQPPVHGSFRCTLCAGVYIRTCMCMCISLFCAASTIGASE